MESTKLYETSLNELKSIEKRMAFDQITINLGKLDGRSKEAIINSLSTTIASRKQAVINAIQGVK